jgi:hypothetical protein
VHRPDLVGGSPALLVELGRKKGERKRGGRNGAVLFGEKKVDVTEDKLDVREHQPARRGGRERAGCTMRTAGLACVKDSSKSNPISSMKSKTAPGEPLA